jgi:hypothetical protein
MYQDVSCKLNLEFKSNLLVPRNNVRFDNSIDGFGLGYFSQLLHTFATIGDFLPVKL